MEDENVDRPGVSNLNTLQIQVVEDASATDDLNAEELQSESLSERTLSHEQENDHKFIQLNTDDGQAQMIPVTGQTQYIQLTQADGSCQFIEVSPGGEVRYIQLDGNTQLSDLLPVNGNASNSDEALPEKENFEVKEEQRDETENQINLQNELKGEQLPDSESTSSLAVVGNNVDNETKENNSKEKTQDDQQEPTDKADEQTKKAESEAVQKVLDLDRPVKLTSETVVVVDGKKCVLRVDPETKHLVAYPLVEPQIPGKRRRGRPKKVIKEEPGTEETEKYEDHNIEDSTDQETIELTEQESSAAQGLLGLSDSGPDGRRKSFRQRKKASFLKDYETGAVDGVPEEGPAAEGETVEDPPKPFTQFPGLIKRGRGRPPKAGITTSQFQSLLQSMGVIPAKRGRGRPRRYPPKDQPKGPIPALIIPAQGGSQMISIPAGLPKRTLLPVKPKEPVSKPPPIIIQQSDGRQVRVVVAHVEPSETSTTKNVHDESDAVDQTTLLLTQAEEAVDALTNGEEADETDVSMDISHDNTILQDNIVEAMSGTKLEGEDSLDIKPEENPSEGNDMNSINVEGASIVHIPQSLIPLLLPKKDPIKIGLKQTPQQLEKLKCPKCDFQAYYEQQFQDHLTMHPEDINKCKCCPFITLLKEELTEHVKDAHPRCICDVCGFTAEHAYIVKRHMMRHNPDGCECHICGKRYKDTYILKMHIKLVHMPAEVLYECNICGKKFTRKAHLKRHLRIHDPDKPFKCPHCDYRGCERSDITKHMLIHDEPRHACEVCGKAFRHMKNKELHVKRHRGQRDYKCGICDFYGYTFTDIRKHIERKHADSKAAVCDKCGMAFKSENLFRDHRRKCELSLGDSTLVPVSSIMAADAATSLQNITSSQMLEEHLTVTDEQVTIPSGPNITVEEIPESVMVEEVNAVTAQPIELAHIPVNSEVTQIVDMSGDVIDTGATVIHDNVQISVESEDMEAASQVEMGEEMTEESSLTQESIDSKISIVSISDLESS